MPLKGPYVQKLQFKKTPFVHLKPLIPTFTPNYFLKKTNIIEFETRTHKFNRLFITL